MKKSKVDTWKSDNSMRSLEEDFLKVAIHFIKALEVNKKNPEPRIKAAAYFGRDFAWASDLSLIYVKAALSKTLP